MYLPILVGFIALSICFKLFWYRKAAPGRASSVVTSTLIGGVFAAIIGLVLGTATPPTLTEEVASERSKLGAMTTGAESKVFLSKGHQLTRDTIVYLNENSSKADAGFSLESALASDSRIFEAKTDEAYLVTKTFKDSNPFWLPFPIDTRTVYNFYVPAGSEGGLLEISSE